MKKILLILSLATLITWIISFLALSYTPIVNIFLFLSILFFIRSVMIVEIPAEGSMTMENSGLEPVENDK